MTQMSFFTEECAWPQSYDDIEALYRNYIYEGETDGALTLKQEKAYELIEKGVLINIITESDLMFMLGFVPVIP